ncbi:hypothetical protein J2X14_001339 [Pantoea alhagi]|uniref:HNH endonuclease n=1 Tax=Mixta sp. BE291 TaxID=3158787 RepID=UPI002863A5B1|nr:hypothetical protein [Pantoea alhagi]
MSFSLPGTDLYYLSRDDLAPERYEEIISPVFAWPRIDNKYVFDDNFSLRFQLINMHERAFNGYTNQQPPHGPRQREKLRKMLFDGGVVMLGDFSFAKGSLFYIDECGALICRDPLAFKFDGARDIIREYNRSVARRDYSKRGGKPRPTALPLRQAQINQPASLKTINSKAAGRLLAAGGMYNGNPEGFADTARKLGGDATKGFDQVLNEQTMGSLTALSALFTAGRAGLRSASVIELKKLESYLGRYKGNRILLQNIDVVEMDYVKRSSAAQRTLRNSFNNTVRREFAKNIADHPDIIYRLDASQREILRAGLIPKEFSVHHKLPLDDNGTNDFSNLVLIRNKVEHSIFTTTQNAIIRGLSPGEHKTVLWPVPKGVVYP